VEIRERIRGPVRVLDLSGRLVLGDGDGLLKNAIKSLTSQGQRQILLNLAEISYVDSCGVGELVAAYTTIVRQGGQIKFVNLSKRVKELLAIAKLLTIFDVVESEEVALEGFGSTTGKQVGM
jgi:anti-sigma B factor antagonist